ncbi:alkaline phosphatase family protein [Sphingobium phenoxybenzoativorans]|uniref:Alkaline phosphatase family protein n=1 Tax=Sphingobium phenoxybenzoativorans TaxID=1592790 RepID=A0A975Q2S6_9SPHN|nr:ectonucleotide pyrophosphatase/phosphodiesterase [Sphingobium phenoxybenzoativorans]QUT07315.1 alkaline phosphatase family protein [Sphingobium phenoxybenzoativorans]
MPLFLRVVFLSFLLIATACAPVRERPAMPAGQDVRPPVTILISIDGFRPDYLDRGVTPHLSRLAAEGVSASMRPSFPSKTFPNHWAIVTGRRPDHNGIVANSMEDASRPGETFTMASDDPFWWNEAEPIWVAAEKAGVRTATMFWPGSNVAWGGIRDPKWPNPIAGGTRPSNWLQFNQAITGDQRVDAVIDWLRRPAGTRPVFLTLYFDTVDTAGHQSGPDAAQTRDAIAQVDRSIGRLTNGLAMLGQTANLVIVSDHGMAATSTDRWIALDTLADPADYRVLETGPFASIYPVPGHEKKLEAALLKPHAHLNCWRKADIPARLHYGANPRVPPYFCLAENGWLIEKTAPKEASAGGTHGYDNAAPDMAALFIANGPAIRRGAPVKPGFDNVDVYPLLARLIGVAPQPGDGDPATLDRLSATP